MRLNLTKRLESKLQAHNKVLTTDTIIIQCAKKQFCILECRLLRTWDSICSSVVHITFSNSTNLWTSIQAVIEFTVSHIRVEIRCEEWSISHGESEFASQHSNIWQFSLSHCSCRTSGYWQQSSSSKYCWLYSRPTYIFFLGKRANDSILQITHFFL